MIRQALITMIFASSCATTTPGAGSHEMGLVQHEREAEAHAKTAEVHAAQQNSSATVLGSCRGRASQLPGEVCWSSVTNPTEIHLREAEKHRKQAADHRAASDALRQAEAQACGGISASDRDVSPFDHPEDLTNVEPLTVRVGGSKQMSMRMVGATVTFRAVPGMTAEWLQRLIDCHLARNAALGHVVPEMPNCPLVPKGVDTHVSSTGNGFAVAISSNDTAIAQEILARSQRLLGRSSDSGMRMGGVPGGGSSSGMGQI